MDERERLISIGRSYSRLRTLQFAPISIALIATPWIVEHTTVSVLLVRASACVLFCVVGYWLVNRYYNRRYGRIKESLDTDSLRKSPLSTCLLVALVLLWGIFFIQGKFTSPYFYLMLVPAGLLGEASWSVIRLRRAYYDAASAASLLILLPALIDSIPYHRFFYLYDTAFLGIITLVIGIFDHLLLVSLFRSPSVPCD